MEHMLYTVSEVATIIKTNDKYVRKLIKANLLPALKLGCTKVRVTALEKFLEQYEGKDLTNPYDIKPLEID